MRALSMIEILTNNAKLEFRSSSNSDINDAKKRIYTLKKKFSDLHGEINTFFYQRFPILTSNLLDSMNIYISINFEGSYIPEHVIQNLMQAARPIDREIVLFRGERRKQNHTHTIVSCDLSNCISSWSTSPIDAMYYAVKLNINNKEDKVHRYQSLFGKSTLFCARILPGTRILPIQQKKENEVLLFDVGEIKQEECSMYWKEIKEELQSAIIYEKDEDDDYILIGFDNVRRFFDQPQQVICGTWTPLDESSSITVTTSTSNEESESRVRRKRAFGEDK